MRTSCIRNNIRRGLPAAFIHAVEILRLVGPADPSGSRTNLNPSIGF